MGGVKENPQIHAAGNGIDAGARKYPNQLVEANLLG